MATGATLTVEDVLCELDRDDSDSEDDFGEYLDTSEREEDLNTVEDEPVVDEVGASMEVVDEVEANVEVASESGSDDSDDLLPEYTLQPGCNFPVGDNRPIRYFSHFITSDMLQNVVTQTNLYARQYIESHDLAPYSRVRLWSKSIFDMSQLQRFLAIILLMGLVMCPEIKSHWAVHWPSTNTLCSNVRNTCNILK